VRGGEVRSSSPIRYVDLPARLPQDHPLRTIRAIVDAALARLDGNFVAIYAPIGRPSIPPEQLLRGLLLQAFYVGNWWSSWPTICCSAGLSVWASTIRFGM
jgi:transposase